MARVTISDCTDKVSSRFKLVLLASARTKQLMRGASSDLDFGGDKMEVVALREIAEGKISFLSISEPTAHSLAEETEADEEISLDGKEAAEVVEAKVVKDSEDDRMTHLKEGIEKGSI